MNRECLHELLVTTLDAARKLEHPGYLHHVQDIKHSGSETAKVERGAHDPCLILSRQAAWSPCPLASIY